MKKFAAALLALAFALPASALMPSESMRLSAISLPAVSLRDSEAVRLYSRTRDAFGQVSSLIRKADANGDLSEYRLAYLLDLLSESSWRAGRYFRAVALKERAPSRVSDYRLAQYLGEMRQTTDRLSAVVGLVPR